MIPFFPVYLFKQEDLVYRLQLAKRIQRLGFKKIGVQFLFIYEDELRHFRQLSKRACFFKEEIENMFTEVLYIAHAPFKPYSRCSLELNKGVAKNLSMITNEFPVELELVNMHLSHPSISDWLKLRMTYQKKQKVIAKIVKILKKLQKSRTRINVENACGVSPLGDHVIYFGNLPSDFARVFSEVDGIRFTLDICHSGVLARVCAHIRTPHKLKNFPGFFEEDFKEIRRIARDKDYAFLSLAENITHVHLSDYKGLNHGFVPGHGDRDLSYITKLVKCVVKSSRNIDMGVLVEVGENDYKKSPNAFQTFKILKCMYNA